ncbi:hypothetical protein [Aureivirga marina]|uniref:hypothetical protein n=1 Tax=Aureivirga marina TaxID=1182451 RepID=UPI0018C96CC4|nr:hypothetical protein [Aureivirga marina]
MKRKILVIILFTLQFSLNYAQKTSKIKEFNPFNETTIYEKDDEKLTLITIRNRKIYLQNFDKQLNFQNQLDYTLSKSKFDKLVNVNYVENGINLFFTNNKEKQFRIISIEEGKKGSYREVVFPFDSEKKELFITFLNVEEKTFIVSVEKNTSTLNFYQIENGNFVKKHTIDFSETFIEDAESGKFYDVVQKNKFQQILKNKENFAENLVSKYKFYVDNSKLFMTLDGTSFRTYVLKVDLKSFDFSFQEIKKQPLNKPYTLKNNSNSFIHSNKLFQTILNKEQVFVSVYDLEKNYFITKNIFNDKSKYENIQTIKYEGYSNMISVDKLDEKTDRKFRRVAIRNNPIISIYPDGSEICLELSSYKKVRENSGGWMVNSGGFYNQAGPVMVYFNSETRTKDIDPGKENVLYTFLNPRDFNILFEFKSKSVLLRINEFLNEPDNKIESFILAHFKGKYVVFYKVKKEIKFKEFK